MRAFIVAAVLAAGCAVAAQSAIEAQLRTQLAQLFPEAAQFSRTQDGLPHFNAYGPGAPGQAPLVGYAFWTTELEPLERGYDGPIKILVGLGLDGVLKGIVVVAHHEPYGYFSIDRPEFAAQFKGKNIRDPFRPGDDVDAVSRATLSVGSATRAIRNSARRAARQLLTPSPH